MKRPFFLGLCLVQLTHSLGYSQQNPAYADNYTVKKGEHAPDFMIREDGGAS